MNKVTFVVIVIVIAAVVLLFNNYGQKSQSPIVSNLSVVCTAPVSRCEGAVLVFYRCSSGEIIENRQNCAMLSNVVNNWTCNPMQSLVKDGREIVRANCDVVARANSSNESSSEPYNETQTTPVQSVANRTINSSAPPLAFCGNGIRDIDETCIFCPRDYFCALNERCDSETGLCKKKQLFGDDICTSVENFTGADCQSCGCSNGFICNLGSRQCQATIADTANVTAVLNSIILQYSSNQTSFLGVEDVVYNGKSAKAAVIDCDVSNTFFCRTIVVVGVNGEILETIHSS